MDGVADGLMGAGCRFWPEAGRAEISDADLATRASCGNVPVCAKELSRLEIDPQANAVKVADFCCRVLASGRPAETISLGPT